MADEPLNTDSASPPGWRIEPPFDDPTTFRMLPSRDDQARVSDVELFLRRLANAHSYPVTETIERELRSAAFRSTAELVDTLILMGVARESLTEASKDIPSVSGVVADVIAVRKQPAPVANRVGPSVAFQATTSADAWFWKKDDGTFQQINPFEVLSNGSDTLGIVVFETETATDPGSYQGPAGLRTGQTITIVRGTFDEDGQLVAPDSKWANSAEGMAASYQVRVAKDVDQAQVDAWLEELGIDADSRSANLDDEGFNYTENLIAAVASAGEEAYYGIRPGMPRPTRRVPLWYDPSGLIEVPYQFGPAAGITPISFLASMNQAEIFDLQDRLRATFPESSWAGASQAWDTSNPSDPWSQMLLTVMAEANQRGAVLPATADVAGNRFIPQTLSGTRGYGMSLNPLMANARAGIDATMDAMQQEGFGQFRIPEWDPRTVVRYSHTPQEIEDEVQQYAQAFLGRKLDGLQLKLLGDHLLAQYAQITQMQDIDAERAYLLSEGALDPKAQLTPEQQAIVENRERPLWYSKESFQQAHVAGQMRKFMDDYFAADYAEMARRAKFQGQQVRQGALNQTVFSAIRAGFGGGGPA